MEKWQLTQMQNLPLEVKIEKTKQRIKEWYEYYNGEVYVSFSGGKDSTVLLHIARQLYPNIPAVFVDTGLEYPELREFVKTFDNVIWLKPKMHFTDVIKKYGYPLISKEQSEYIYDYVNTKSEKQKNKRWNGINGSYKISEKWKFLVNAPFKISHKCCTIMKKDPIKKYEKETGRNGILGIMANESQMRQREYLKHGCNGFNMKRPISNPMGFWTEQDILQYIQTYETPYASVYGDIIEEDGKLKTTLYSRTGCMFCGYGCHLQNPNNFQRMKITHPKLWDYCINKLGVGEVLDYIKVDYN